ncbi:MAG: hypothetical protein VKI81_03080 [Synechococcaceae cyanobacterium]|nr:hypothetical protein [Synechococcaceae cyanobacterium]
MRPLLPLAAALLSAALLGCQPTAQREDSAQARVCADLAAVDKALQQVAALQPSSTVGEARAANDALTSALGRLNRSEEQLERLRIRDFRDQLRAFDREARGIASNKKITLEEAAAELKQKAQPVIAARKRISADVKCPAPAAGES